MCNFEISWTGKCKEPEFENGMCEKHSKQKCTSCGEPATHDCEETSSLVCGAPLCNDCEHTIRTNGCNSGAPLPEGLKCHCKKKDQKCLPWYVDTEELKQLYAERI